MATRAYRIEQTVVRKYELETESYEELQQMISSGEACSDDHCTDEDLEEQRIFRIGPTEELEPADTAEEDAAIGDD